MGDSNVPITAGSGTLIDSYQLADGTQRQYVIAGSYGGGVFRAGTFITPGRAGTTGQRILSLFNAGTVPVEVQFVGVDIYQTVVKALTVAPPLVRVQRITAASTNGTALSKTPMDSNFTSNANVTVLGDASADTTASASALTNSALGGIFTQEAAPRFITAAGYEPADRMEFLQNGAIMCRQNQGVCLNLAYTNASSNPTTDMWVAVIQWEELP